MQSFISIYSGRSFINGQTCQNYNQYRECTSDNQGCMCTDYSQVCGQSLPQGLLNKGLLTKLCAYTLSQENTLTNTIFLSKSASLSDSMQISSSRTISKESSASVTNYITRSKTLPISKSNSLRLTLSATDYLSSSLTYLPTDSASLSSTLSYTLSQTLSKPNSSDLVWKIANQFNATLNNPWVQVVADAASGSPSGRWGHAMVIDSFGIMWMFGGWDGGSSFNDLWIYDTKSTNPSWVNILPNNPSRDPKSSSALKMVISNTTGKIFLISNNITQVWELNIAFLYQLFTKQYMNISWEVSNLQANYTAVVDYSENYGVLKMPQSTFNNPQAGLIVPAPTNPGNHLITLQLRSQFGNSTINNISLIKLT